MYKPSEQNTTSGAVMISYRSKKGILYSSASDISKSSGKPVFDAVQHKSTLHVQKKELIREVSAPVTGSIEELSGA